MRIPYLALLVGVVVALCAGCSASVCAGSGCGIDTAKAQSSVKSLVASATGADVTSVSCPSKVAFKKGASFTCIATGADGTTAPILLTQTDAKGNVHISAPDLVHTGGDAKLIASGLTSKLKFTVTVKCPDLVTAHKGTTFDCVASHGTETQKVLVTVTDDQGSIDYRTV
jgi:uncharacterized protein DUF4333